MGFVPTHCLHAGCGVGCAARKLRPLPLVEAHPAVQCSRCEYRSAESTPDIALCVLPADSLTRAIGATDAGVLMPLTEYTCNWGSRAYHRHYSVSAPELLIFHVRRLGGVSGITEHTYMLPYADHMYARVAVVKHIGATPSAGHYCPGSEGIGSKSHICVSL